jgi:hypothetical protein
MSSKVTITMSRELSEGNDFVQGITKLRTYRKTHALETKQAAEVIEAQIGLFTER